MTKLIQFIQPIAREFQDILNPTALELITQLELRFGARRRQLMQDRQIRQALLDQGGSLDFLTDTQHIKENEWRVASIPAEIQDRRVEITGPADRKMMINALNSGAKVFMADLEDAHSPTFEGTLQAQVNLKDGMDDRLFYVDPTGKQYKVNESPAVLMVRIRGLHMEEKSVHLDGENISASFYDLGLFIANNFQCAERLNKGLYLYLPKMEHYLEARLFSEVLSFTHSFLGIQKDCLRCTALIETIPAAFQMEEILYELKRFIVGLNAGRWDYIFSYIKRFKNHADKVLPERAQVTMTTHFLRSYSQLLVEICHKRGAHAMGGMAAQIPIKNDPEANAAAAEKVRLDKLREVQDGHDGTWVAHPALVPIALAVFNEHMPQANQINRPLSEKIVHSNDLLNIPKGTITPAGLYTNVSAALQYIMAWLQGRGAVPIFNLMEDAATAEISRAQLWQWIRTPNLKCTQDEPITLGRIQKLITQEVEKLSINLPKNTENSLIQAASILRELVEEDQFEEFLTIPAYQLI